MILLISLESDDIKLRSVREDYHSLHGVSKLDALVQT